jgi:inorganic phosphate transporter, PiT family
MATFQILLIGVALLLAYANGANDNFKGVATLYGGGSLSYSKALSVATVATLLGSLASLYLAAGLLKSFHGVGLVPATLVGNARFVFAMGLGAAITVLLAALLGMPISTTHALLGAMLGAALASGAIPKWHVLDHGFVIPLLFSPLAVIPVTAVADRAVARLIPASLPPNETCLCVGEEAVGASVLPGNVASALTTLTLTVAPEAECRERYADTVVRVNADHGLDSLHVLSAGAVSFARGINDTPKMAALLTISPVIGTHETVGLLALVIALGGLFGARRVAETMSHRITRLEPRRGLAANLATAFMVLVASRWGMPVSTTHVSCGALFGVGALSGDARWQTIRGIIIAWMVTLPAAAAVSAAAIAVLG